MPSSDIHIINTMENKLDSKFIDITKEVQKLSDICISNGMIESDLYVRNKVNRGLRDLEGNGVLTGLTEISDIIAFTRTASGEKIPCDGELYFRGINIYDLVDGFIAEGRAGFEETTYLLIFGKLPNKKELKDFNALLSHYRTLPTSFVRDIIMKAPSNDMMNTLTRSVLTLFAYDDYANDTSIPNVLRQSLLLIAVFPMLAVYGYQA
ncbi:MAG: citrate synthase, partial [Clostridiales Family XIII bacterium]|nr:citrate synthase [Clostridiales Family XIII bacterium]